MPRSFLLRPLGGLTGKTRKRYALFQKIMLVEESNRLRVEQNFSICRAGEVLGMPSHFCQSGARNLPGCALPARRSGEPTTGRLSSMDLPVS